MEIPYPLGLTNALSLFIPAYEILSDPTKRKEYDLGGGSFSSFGKGTRAQDFHFNFDDLFKQFENDIFGDMKGHFSSHFANHFASHQENTGGAFNFESLFEQQVSERGTCRYKGT